MECIKIMEKFLWIFEDNQITFENADTLINYGILEGRDTIAPCDACSCFCLTMHLYLMKLILLTPVHLLIMKNFTVGFVLRENHKQ